MNAATNFIMAYLAANFLANHLVFRITCLITRSTRLLTTNSDNFFRSYPNPPISTKVICIRIHFVTPQMWDCIISVQFLRSPASSDCAFIRMGCSVSSRYTFPYGLGSALSANRIALYSFRAPALL